MVGPSGSLASFSRLKGLLQLPSPILLRKVVPLSRNIVPTLALSFVVSLSLLTLPATGCGDDGVEPARIPPFTGYERISVV